MTGYSNYVFIKAPNVNNIGAKKGLIGVIYENAKIKQIYPNRLGFNVHCGFFSCACSKHDNNLRDIFGVVQSGKRWC